MPAEGNHEVRRHSLWCGTRSSRPRTQHAARNLTTPSGPSVHARHSRSRFHQACVDCPAVDGIANSLNNFTEYQARMWSIASVGAGAVSGSGTNRYYSFNQGTIHFLVFTAEAYAYSSGKEFLANQAAFMKKDLAGVDRSVTPVSVTGHGDARVVLVAVPAHSTCPHTLCPRPCPLPATFNCSGSLVWCTRCAAG